MSPVSVPSNTSTSPGQPTFSETKLTADIKEDLQPGEMIIDVNVTEEKNKKVEYNIILGNEKGKMIFNASHTTDYFGLKQKLLL